MKEVLKTVFVFEPLHNNYKNVKCRYLSLMLKTCFINMFLLGSDMQTN